LPVDDTLRARWFDGRSGRARPVLLRLRSDGHGRCGLRLHPLDAAGSGPLELRHGQFEWPDTWEPARGLSTLTVDLRNHGSLQVDGADWQAALAACGVGASLVQRIQARWPWIIAALVAALLLAGAFARWGTPWAAAQLARHAPLSWELQLSREALAQLDARGALKPSRLPPERQAQLRADYTRLHQQVSAALQPDARYQPVFDLQFRSGMGPNALALPGGTLVLTDAMVELAKREGLGDDALMGVLAHETGHVLYRHGTRRLIELGLLNGAMAVAFGDVSGIVNTASTLLAGLAYSRSHEREADCFAIAFMQGVQRPLAPMADLLQAAERQMRGTRTSSRLGEWARTHPDTAQRVHRLKAGHVAGCSVR